MTAAATGAVLAVDGGNSKTDVALLAADGSLLAHVRGAGSNHQTVGVDAAQATLAKLVDAVRDRAGITADAPLAEVAALCLAGADLPADIDRTTAWARRRGWAPRVVVDTDIAAMLHASPHADNAVAVVCGGGINAIGLRGRDGATARFPALGMLTGDWGGGGQLAMEVMFAASRAEDGRGPATVLVDEVRALWGVESVRDAAIAVHTGRIGYDRLHELPPLIFTAATAGDTVARGLVDRLSDEIAAWVLACLRHLDLLRCSRRRGAAFSACGLAPHPPGTPEIDVLLAGGVLVGNAPVMLPALRQRLAGPAPAAEVRLIDAPPIAGAAILGFGHLPTAVPTEVLGKARSALIAELHWRV
ncbi:MAG TPA: BadF/BadG/BcrA/BcrD ATPase family protein [Pseudonocardiaceae bacterium]